MPAAPSQGSPFVPYGPGSHVMAGDADRAHSQSMGVLAIIGGLLFMVGAAVVTVGLMVLAWMFLVDKVPDTTVSTDAPRGHVQDTGVASPVPIPEPGGGVGAGVAPPVDDKDPPDFAAAQVGPATIIVPDTMLFHSIELNCPGGIRTRGKFRPYNETELKATAQRVPADERCVVTFQGSEPARTHISGNHTLTCTFNPVVCHRVY